MQLYRVCNICITFNETDLRRVNENIHAFVVKCQKVQDVVGLKKHGRT